MRTLSRMSLYKVWELGVTLDWGDVSVSVLSGVKLDCAGNCLESLLAWWYMPVILEHGKLRQKHHLKFKG